MNKKVLIPAVVVLLIAVSVAIGWLYFRANPAAWEGFLAEMQGEGSSTAPQPARPRSQRSEGLMASGTIEAEEFTIAAETGGRVVALGVSQGDVVQAGDLLLQLDQESWLAQQEGAAAAVAQAQAAREAAQAQLDLARAGATPEEIAAAQGAVLSAQGGLAAAEAAVAQAEIGAEIARSSRQAQSAVDMAEAALAQAQGVLSAAQADLARAQAEQARLLAGARPEEIAIYQALLAQAEAELWYPTQVHQQLIDNNLLGTQEEQARYQVQAVRAARDAAQAQLDLVQAGATANEAAIARAGVSAAEAQVTIAQAGVEAAQAGLDQANNALTLAQNEVALAGTGLSAAEAQVEVAQGQLAQAEAQRDRLQAGATAEEIAILEAQAAQAQAALASAEAALRAIDLQLAQTALSAPVGGIILECLIHAGELATPAAPLLTLADLDQVTLTVYVPEADLGQVSLGQEVEVTVDAYGEAFAGEVSHIASQAEFTPSNVQTQEERVHMVFAVKVRLDNPEHRLKPGMPADAAFLP